MLSQYENFNKNKVKTAKVSQKCNFGALLSKNLSVIIIILENLHRRIL